jgi:cell division protein ZipA
MSNLQITLSIVGVLLIIAIIGHGLWTMRRNSQKMTQQKEQVAAKRQRASATNAGFDDDGVGEVRVVKKREHAQPDTDDKTASTHKPNLNESKSSKVNTAPSADDEIEQMSMNLDLEDDNTPLPSMRVNKDEADALQQAEFELTANDNDEQAEAAPEPDIKTKAELEHDPEAEPAPELEPESTAAEPTMQKSTPPPAQEVISLFVKGSVQGAVLLQMMTELGCKFGEMGIFHRYEQTSGNGPLIFSVANMFNPGTFDLDNIENFETEGVAMFMTLPLDYDGQQAFNMMLNAAKKLAMEIPQGQVLDGQRQVLSRQSIQKTHQTIREFEKAQAGSV